MNICFFLSIQDLRNMYKLLKPVPNGLGINVLVEETQRHLTNIGLEAVKGLKGDNVSIFFLN